jgi:cell division protein FtsB
LIILTLHNFLFNPQSARGSRWLRWILIELSQHFINGSERLKKMYLRISKTYGKKTAKVAVARQMLKVIYYMLRDRKPFIKG